MQKITLSLLALIFYTMGYSQTTATYNITFTNFWNSTDHNGGSSLPSNAHWSDLAITNHNTSVTFFEMGVTASAGVELIAELGNVSTFQSNDYLNAFNANNAQQFINAGDLFLSSGNTIQYNGIEISEDFPLLTMLSMIAPSPDWFIGINGLNLRDAGGWKNSITVDLFPYDAGTEEGTTYMLTNPDTNPVGVISTIQGVAPFNSEKVAQVEITLQSVLSTKDDVSKLSNIKIFPNPVKDKLLISNIENTGLKSIEIFNVLGKLSQSISIKSNAPSLDINVSNLKSGIYLLKLNTIDGVSYTKKLMIK